VNGAFQFEMAGMGRCHLILVEFNSPRPRGIETAS
jgi:hypothetical protein